MEKFYLEIPTVDRKEDAFDFINEFNKYHSNINGVGGLTRYLDDYDGWLKKLDDDFNREEVTSSKVPARTYFLVRENDNKIVGMINIRLKLNEALKEKGKHIGYCIRPSERGKGYNKINLYLALKVCEENGIEEALLDADINNIASWKTMEALGGIRVGEMFVDESQEINVDYMIPVSKSLEEHSREYDQYISDENKKIKR